MERPQEDLDRDLEAELEAMLAEQVGTSVVSTVLRMASEITLGDLKDLAAQETGAASLKLSEVFEEYVRTKNLVKAGAGLDVEAIVEDIGQDDIRRFGQVD
jgi:hypothetical protein